MPKKTTYILITTACFILCVLIVKLFETQPFIRGFVGDVLVISLIYFFVRIFINPPVKLLACAVLAFAFLIECLQYFRLVEQLGWQHNRLAVIVLGATFDPVDLIAYTIGAVIAYFVDLKLIQDQ